MRIGRSIAVTGEMLIATLNPVFLKRIIESKGHISGNDRIAAEGPFADDCILRIGEDVCNGSKIDVNSVFI